MKWLRRATYLVSISTALLLPAGPLPPVAVVADPSPAAPAALVAQASSPTTDAGQTSQGSEEILTNDTIMAMVRAGLSERTIVAKIRSSRRKFDTSSQALIRLKGAGVPEAVIEAMLSPGDAPPAASQAASGGPSAGTPGPTEQGASNPLTVRQAHIPGPLKIFHVGEGALVPLKASPGHLEMSRGVFSVKIELVIGGRHAAYRIRDRQPVFRTDHAQPEGIHLARLRIGEEDDRNLKLRGHNVFQTTMRLGYSIDDDDEVKLNVEPDPQGGYRLRPRTPLAPGEYGFVGLWPGARSAYVPEFGLD